MFRGSASADNSDMILLPFGVGHHQEISETRPPNTQEAVLACRMIRIRDSQLHGIAENRGCFRKTDSVLFLISEGWLCFRPTQIPLLMVPLRNLTPW